MRHQKPGWVPIIIVALVLLAVGLVEGDVAENLTKADDLVTALLNRVGAAACLALLYIEESGIPLPVPGDFYIAFMGHLYAGSLSSLLTAWLAIIVVVVAGASNLYWLSRRWGRRLLQQPFVARLLHVDASRLERAHQWFERWGPLAIIFGRHLPGFRITITLIAATAGVPYRVFAPSVAISTAIWAAIALWLGATLGQSIGRILSGNTVIYLVVFAGLIVLLAVVLVRGWRGRSVRPSLAG
jgi:membrane protein DedA with SNARE-associated domain